MKNKIAFTLAEVLITLGIIGVVAAMTLPTLINKIEDMHYRTAYKKAWSVASQAFLSASSQGLLVERSAWNDTPSNEENFEAFRKQFIITKSCDNDTSSCWAADGEKIYGIPHTNQTKGFIDNSGFVWLENYETSAVTGGLVVDTNGLKRPNRYGKDRFIFSTEVGNIQCGAGGADSGIPTHLCVWGEDYLQVSHACPTPPCYYQSWLFK